MACRDSHNESALFVNGGPLMTVDKIPEVLENVDHLLFGVDTSTEVTKLLQNNIDLFEWVTRNKMYPLFCGRNILGKNSLTVDEIKYIQDRGCKIAVICSDSLLKLNEEQGMFFALKVALKAQELKIPRGVAIYLEIENNEGLDRDFLRGYAKGMLSEGYTPGFKANTDARYSFDREFSRGMQTDRVIFEKCLIWAVAPSLAEYDRMTTTHLIHPDNWMPYAPSGITRKEIAIWQYGKECHAIESIHGDKTFFNLNVVRNEQVVFNKML